MRKGCLYFHFPGKDAIAREVFREAADEFMGFLDSVLDGDNPGAALDGFFRCALDKHVSSGFVGGCIFGNTALEMSDFNPEFAAMVADFFDAWLSRIALVAAKAQRKSQIRDDIPPETLARLIIATIEGGIMMSRLKKNEQPLKDCLDTLRTTLEIGTS